MNCVQSWGVDLQFHKEIIKYILNRWVIRVQKWNQWSHTQYPFASWQLLKCSEQLPFAAWFSLLGTFVALCSFNAIYMRVSSSLLFQALNMIQQLLNRSLITHRGGNGKSLLPRKLIHRSLSLAKCKKYVYKKWPLAEFDDLFK